MPTGDFILSSECRLLFAYQRHDPADRLAVDTLILSRFVLIEPAGVVS